MARALRACGGLCLKKNSGRERRASGFFTAGKIGSRKLEFELQPAGRAVSDVA